MVKFSFFTVRSKCCKKSKFVVLFLFFFVCWIWNFQILYILRLRFFLCLFLRCSLWLLLLPSINVFLLHLLNVLYSLLCMCAFSHSLFFLFRVSQLDNLDLVLSQKMPAPTIPNSQQIAKKDSQEKEIPFSYSHLPSLSFILKRANARAQEERVCRDAPPHLRADDRSTNRPRDSERIRREILMRYLRGILLPDYSLLRSSLSFWSKIPCLSLITTSYRTRGGRDEPFVLVPKKHKTTNRDDNDNERTRYTSVRARRLIDHVRRRRRCRNKKTRQLVGFLMVFLRSRTTINYDLFLINSNSLPVKYNHYNYVCVCSFFCLFVVFCFSTVAVYFRILFFCSENYAFAKLWYFLVLLYFCQIFNVIHFIGTK